MASIKSAKAHRFIHEEAMAHERFGIYFLEHDRAEEGTKYLCTAVEQFGQWGAASKAAHLEQFIIEVDPSGCLART